jgi:ubiquinol-cytochrome c reductase cytochrome b subunit
MAAEKNVETTGLLGWVDERFPLTSNWKAHLSEYYAPKNFNFWYYFGSLAIVVLVLQILVKLLKLHANLPEVHNHLNSFIHYQIL